MSCDRLHVIRVLVGMMRVVLWRTMFYALGYGHSIKLGRRVIFFGWPRVTHLVGGHLEIGDHARLARCQLTILPDAAIKIGEKASINENVFISAAYGIDIGNETMVASNVSIRDHDHASFRTDISMQSQGFVGARIYIGRDVWIGSGVSVLKGVTIGDGAILGANAGATRDVPKFGVAVGGTCPNSTVPSYSKSGIN